MGRISVLVPTEEMVHLSHNILQEGRFSDIQEVIQVSTEDAVAQARQAAARGSSILVARGLQAALIKRHTSIPVVEIVISAQEMALLIQRARQLILKERPTIAVAGNQNMFCDMSRFEDIFHINLQLFLAQDDGDLEKKAREAAQSGADLLIGGNTVIAAAKEAGVPSLFLSNTEDSLRTAFLLAQSMDLALQNQKRSQAQMDVLLDSRYMGALTLNPLGEVLSANSIIVELLGMEQARIIGQPVCALFPDLDQRQLTSMCMKKQSPCSLIVHHNSGLLLCTCSPVVIDGMVDSVLVSCQKLRQKTSDAPADRGGDSRAPRLPFRFSDLSPGCQALERSILQARIFAQATESIFLWGPDSLLLLKMAAALHNEGPRSSQAFVELDMEELSFQDQKNLLFGERGAVTMAEGGTLYLAGAQAICPQIQKSLFHLARSRMRRNAQGKRLPANLRLILSSPFSLRDLSVKGQLIPSLYTLLEYFSLEVPSPLLQPDSAKEQILQLFHQLCEKHESYHQLTAGGLKELGRLDWGGSPLKLETFLARLILESSRRSIDEIAVSRLLQAVEPPASAQTAAAPPPEAEKITEALRLHGGNRQSTARYLGISTATLWRKMKKYRLSPSGWRE